MYCQYCGSAISDHAQFCGSCGRRQPAIQNPRSGTAAKTVPPSDFLQKKDGIIINRDLRTARAQRSSIAVLLGIALLMFFFPLLDIHVPVAGDQSVSGYELFSKMTEFRHNFDANASATIPTDEVSSPSTTAAKPLSLDMPLSLQFARLVPLFIFAAFTSAALALVALLNHQEAIKMLLLGGGCFGILTIVDVAIIDSDMRTWMTQSLADNLKDNPFAAFGTLVANSFHLDVGAGLYMLTGCLLLAALVASGVLSPHKRSGR